MKETTIGVLFTGGLDSTYLLYDNLRKGYTVQPYYVNVANNSKKSKIEQQQANIIISKLKEVYGNNIKELQIICNIDININHSSLAIVQTPIWIFALQWIQNDVTELQIGYVLNDCAISFIPDILTLYNAYNGLTDNDLVPLTFPLIKIGKHPISEHLPVYLRQLVFSCETPTTDELIPCGECDTCRKYNFLHGEKEWCWKDYSSLVRKIYDNSITTIPIQIDVDIDYHDAIPKETYIAQQFGITKLEAVINLTKSVVKM